MYIRRFTYKPEDVDCKLCTQYKKCDRNLMKCPWIAERIEAGAVSYQEAVLTAFPGKGLSFERLLKTIQVYPGTFWLNKQHKDRMEMFNHRLGYVPKRNTPVYYAVMYLLTTSEELFRRTSNCFYHKGIEFDYAVLRNISLHDYALYAVSKDLYTGTVKLTLLDMADREIVDDEAFRLIINATLIAKYGVQAFNLQKEVPKNGY